LCLYFYDINVFLTQNYTALKKFTFLAFTAIFIFSLTNSFAQQKPGTLIGNGERLRCATMEALELYFRDNPEARELAERNKTNIPAAPSNNTQRTNAIVTIPVVVHIVGSTTRLAQVTDADVIWQINKMNEDFGGTNADSTNAPGFYGIRGHSEIRFCLAQQDPAGNPTNGIVRVVSNLTSGTLCSGSNYQLLKSSSSCGSDAWDPSRYFNIWVGEVGACLLGVAQFPGTNTPATDGIVLAYEGFSNNPAYVDPAFALGRTAVHEAGHYFGLYHIWGDESGCTNSDFRQMPGTCLIAGSTIVGGTTDQTVGDTPNQAGSTSGCPSGVRTDACTGAAPGINYQNYMDYTDDACYSMFTNRQVERMQWVLDNCRASLKTSNGCVPVAAFALDAGATKVISPGAGNCAVGGSSTSICPSTSIVPAVEIKNYGTTTITSLQIYTQIGTNPAVLTNWTGSLTSFSSTTVTLNTIVAPSASGTYQMKIYTSNPNGGADQQSANDTAYQTLTVGAGQPLPLTESFTGTTFPPTGWRLINPDNGITWTRWTSASFSSPASARIDFFNYFQTGQKDLLATPAVDISAPIDSIKVTFRVSHAGYSPSFGPDSLELVYSPDCGSTWLNFGGYLKWTEGPPGNNLSTSGYTTSNYAPTSASQWREETVTVRPNFPGNPQFILLGWRATTGFGNNLFIDNINIEKIVLPPIDAGVVAISNPLARECSSTATPQVTIRNFGSQTITSAKVNYRIDGGPVTTFNWTGSLDAGQTTTVTLPVATLGAAGQHTFTAFTSEPNGFNPDGNTSNDALSKNYRVNTISPLTNAVREGFTGTFPPSGWEVVNPNNDLTWQRNTTIGRNTPSSAWFNDWNNPTFGRTDDLALPNFSYSGIDSIFLTFEVAAATYTQPGNTGVRMDTLTVLLSKDCGNTFIPVYKKWGEDLQTVNDPNFPRTDEFFPNSKQWRKDSVNLGQWLGSSEDLFQVAFRFSGNFENNLFLDDVNLYTEILPEKLKTQGYLILPNPFKEQFNVWHYLTPTSLKYITVYNSAGQQVWKQQYDGNAQRLITIDLTGKASGVYFVQIGYDDVTRNVRQQIVKY